MLGRTDVSVYNGIIFQPKLKNGLSGLSLSALKLIPGCPVSCCYSNYLELNKWKQNVFVYSEAHSWDGLCFWKWNNTCSQDVGNKLLLLLCYR